MSEEISAHIKQKCYQLCVQYLSLWENIRKDEIIFKRIVGGITNEMYYCGLPQHIIPNDSEPQEVAIKIYRTSERPLDAKDSIMTDIIIGLIISQNGLGPKIYGISPDSVIMEYIKCHQFNDNDLKNPLIVEELGRKLAKVHSLEPPINRTINWFYETFNNKNINIYKSNAINELIKENNLNYFIENDFETEFKLLKSLVLKSDSSIVFSHNDFGFNNILVKDSIEINGKIVLTDFEFSSYGFRGRDFGIVFEDWLYFNGLDYEHKWESIIKPFLENYFDESVGIKGNSYANDANNSVKHLLNETKIFLLVQYMFSIVYHLNVNESVMKQNKLDLMKNANQLFGRYLKLKNRLKEENVITLLAVE